ncbi:uncharacterized protein [Diadema antillarum]|uniref:uncharacterized protein n=1 Tax=Diadema antillarum TaxID=105358 RepID=UPI003A848D7D
MASSDSNASLTSEEDERTLVGPSGDIEPSQMIRLSSLSRGLPLSAISESTAESVMSDEDVTMATNNTDGARLHRRRFSKTGLELREVQSGYDMTAGSLGHGLNDLGRDNAAYSADHGDSNRSLPQPPPYRQKAGSVEIGVPMKSRSDRSRKVLTNSKFDFRQQKPPTDIYDAGNGKGVGDVTMGKNGGKPSGGDVMLNDAVSHTYVRYNKDSLLKDVKTKLKKTKLRRKHSPLVIVNLIDAVRDGDMEILKSLLDKYSSFNLNKLDKNHMSLLHHAAINNRDVIARDLVIRGADTEVKTLDTKATPLHFAARMNSAAVAHVLLAQCANVESATTAGMTPLHISARRGHIAVTKELLSLGKASVSAQDSEGATPLHYGAMSGNPHVCRLLIEHGADIRAKEVNDMTPLMNAIVSGHEDLVDIFIEKAMRSGVRIKDYLADRDNESNTCLHLAVSKRRTKVSQILLDGGVDVNVQKTNGMTPLHIAAVNGATDTAYQLLRNGADIELVDDEGMTPLHRAALYNRVETVALLIHEGAVIDEVDNNGFTPLLCTAWKGHVPAGDLLLTRGADINVFDHHHKSPLHWAAEMDHPEFVAFLLKNGGQDLNNLPDIFERTALHYAAEVGNVEIVRLLLEYKARSDARDGLEKTPVHVAAQAGYVHCVEELLRDTPDLLNEDDRDGMTPLLTACYYGHHRVAMTLLKMGADVSKVNDEYRTALILAAANNHVMTMSLLIEHNCDVNAIDKTKNTALHLCCDAGHIAAANLLIRAGADQSCSNDQGFTPLELAIEREQGEIAAAIIKCKDWRVAMQSRDEQMISPMKALIEKLPDVALLVMDRCVHQTSINDPKNPSFITRYDYKYIDPGPDDESTNVSGRYFALRTMCQFGREKLLEHELSQNILKRKWDKFGRFFYFTDLLMYMMFIAVVTAYSLFTPTYTEAYYNPDINEWGDCPYYNFTRYPELAWYVYYNTEKDRYFYIQPVTYYLGYAVLSYTMGIAFGELIEMYIMRFQYFTDVSNLIDWVTIITATVFVMPPGSPPCFYNWNAGIIAVFCVWMKFIMYFRGFHATGLYVLMFIETFTSILKAMAVYVMFIIAFSVSFNMCLGTMYAFSNMPMAFLSVLTMMLGEINKGDIFAEDVDLSPFEFTIYALFVIFLLIMPVVINNLTIGIAVGDIDGIKKKAFIRRNTMQANYVYHMEVKWPRCMQRILYQPENVVTVKPRGGKYLSWLFPDENDALVERDDKSDPRTAEHVLAELQRQKSTLATMMLIQKQQSDLLRTLADKEGVSTKLQDVTAFNDLYDDVMSDEENDNDPTSSLA